jgi:CRP/FNR family transcriptional regulator, cyclic AMP receptor protein
MSRSRGEAGKYESPSLHMLMRRSWERPTGQDWVDVLGAMPLFSGLSKRQLRQLAKVAKVGDHDAGEVIVQTGDAGDALYLVLEGRARVLGKSGRDLRPGDWFGEMGLIDGGPRSATLTATTPLRTMKLPRRAFMRALKQDPGIGLKVMEQLAGRIRRLERRSG